VNRLLEAPRFKDAVKDSGAHLGLIVSPQVYETVISASTPATRHRCVPWKRPSNVSRPAGADRPLRE
jgi:hypothetical protein